MGVSRGSCSCSSSQLPLVHAVVAPPLAAGARAPLEERCNGLVSKVLEGRCFVEFIGLCTYFLSKIAQCAFS